MATRPDHGGDVEYAIGLDIGTSAVKASVLTSDGRESTYVSHDYPTSAPHAGWAEQDPEDWWNAVGEVLNLVVTDFPTLDSTNAVLALSGQMHTTVLRTESGESLRPAILWSDARARESASLLRSEFPSWTEVAGNPPIPAFTSAHLRWVRDHEPEVFGRIGQVSVPKDDIRSRLGAGWATDPSDASAMNLLEIRGDTWSPELLAAVGISATALPPVRPSAEITGTIASLPPMLSGGGRRLLGVPVIAGAADQAAQAYALGATTEGRIAVSIGTSGAALQAIGQPRAGAFRHCLPDVWLALDSTHAAGLALAWWSGVAGLPLESIASLSPTSRSEGPIFLPYLQGGRDGRGAPGTLTDLRTTHGATDILNAVAEGVGIELVRLVRETAGDELPDDVIGIGGRAAQNRTLRAVLATGLDRSIRYSDRGPAHGVARLAAIARGWLDPRSWADDQDADVTHADPGLAEHLARRMDRFERLARQLSRPDLGH